MASTRGSLVLLSIFVLKSLSAIPKIQPQLTFTEIAGQFGYESEKHTVITEDGYLLTIFRITKGQKCMDKKRKTPVLLMPGLLASADSSLDAGVENGLPYLISDACFDIWIGNPRGTYYGRKHTTLDPDNDKEFWKFSVDEIGYYDVPATIDYVLNNTGAPKLNYIGSSQGAGTYFIMCSERVGYCDKSKVVIGLAAATKHTYAKSKLMRTAFKLVLDGQGILEKGTGEVFERSHLLVVLSSICRSWTYFCEVLVNLIDGPHPGSFENETYRKILDHNFAGTSVQNIVRYAQSLESNKYVKFDYGIVENLQIYGQMYPPEYNLSAVTVPSVLLHGRNDAIVDSRDMDWLVKKLPNVKDYVVVEDPLWNHLDMFFSQYMRNTTFPIILKYLLEYD